MKKASFFIVSLIAIFLLLEVLLVYFTNSTEESHNRVKPPSFDGIPACDIKVGVHSILNAKYCGKKYSSLRREFGKCPLINRQSECPLKRGVRYE